MPKDDEVVQTVLRLPKSLHTKIHEAAAGVHSANSEMIQRLSKSFEADGTEKRLSAMERLLAQIVKMLAK